VWQVSNVVKELEKVKSKLMDKKLETQMKADLKGDQLSVDQ
jgi:hypothetical protein